MSSILTYFDKEEDVNRDRLNHLVDELRKAIVDVKKDVEPGTRTAYVVSGGGGGGSVVGGMSGLRDNAGSQVDNASGYVRITDDGVVNADKAAGDELALSIAEAQIDHGSIGGLSDDDHSQYILVDGSRAFSANQSMGVNKLTSVGTPSSDQDAANKLYVDNVVPNIVCNNNAVVCNNDEVVTI